LIFYCLFSFYVWLFIALFPPSISPLVVFVFQLMQFSSRDGNGSGLDQVDWKPDPQKNIVGLNLTPEPTGEIWHPTHRVLSQVRVPVGFYKLVSFRFFGFLSGFGCTRGWVKNETCTQTRFCAGRFWVQVTGVKMYLNPHPSGAKPAGYLKPEPELPSLVSSLAYPNLFGLKRFGFCCFCCCKCNWLELRRYVVVLLISSLKLALPWSICNFFNSLQTVLQTILLFIPQGLLGIYANTNEMFVKIPLHI
jgi:hypothetical protein